MTDLFFKIVFMSMLSCNKPVKGIHRIWLQTFWHNFISLLQCIILMQFYQKRIPGISIKNLFWFWMPLYKHLLCIQILFSLTAKLRASLLLFPFYKWVNWDSGVDFPHSNYLIYDQFWTWKLVGGLSSFRTKTTFSAFPAAVVKLREF